MIRNGTINRLAALCALLSGGAVLAQDAGDLDPLRTARDALIDAADFGGALRPAERIVDALEEAQDPALGYELLPLARIQAGLGDLRDAEETYLRAIEEISAAEGAAAPALIVAYQGLGRNYLNDRRFGEALLALDEARNLSRRHQGLFNIEQTPILDDITLAQLGTGNTIDAKTTQLTRLENAVRRFGDGDPQVIPFHTQLGDYLDNSRLRVAARAQYERALEISTQHSGAASTTAVTLLRRLAEIDLMLDRDDGVPAQIETALSDAEALDPAERARALLALGDHALVYQGQDAAAPRYREAFDVVVAAGDDIDRNTLFDGPRPLNLVPPLGPVDRGTRALPWTWGTLTIAFDVSADGRASGVTLVEMQPEDEDVADAYIRRIREAYFRPRLVNGDPVGTADIRYSQNFRYYVRED